MVKWLVAAVWLFLTPAAAQTITDGDTLKLSGTTYRLWGIDAPETKQDCPDGWPAGRLATTHLQSLIAGRSVICERRDTDRYGRTVAVVLIDGQNVNRALVRQGAAWAYLRYLDDPVLVELEAEARAAQQGLWALQADQIMAPWKWRRRR